MDLKLTLRALDAPGALNTSAERKERARISALLNEKHVVFFFAAGCPMQSMIHEQFVRSFVPAADVARVRFLRAKFGGKQLDLTKDAAANKLGLGAEVEVQALVL